MNNPRNPTDESIHTYWWTLLNTAQTDLEQSRNETQQEITTNPDKDQPNGEPNHTRSQP